MYENGKLESKYPFTFNPNSSKTYNTYSNNISPSEDINKKYNRICNGKSIDLKNNFYFEKEGEKIFFRNIKRLYIPQKGEKGIVDIHNYIDNNLEEIREIYNDEIKLKDSESELIKYLIEIGLPLDDKIILKKLLEFEKFIYKEVLPSADERLKESNDGTGKLASSFYKSIRENGDYEKMGKYKIAPIKTADRFLEKSIQEHGGRIEKVGDLTRATVVSEDFEDMINDVNSLLNDFSTRDDVLSIKLSDKVGSLFKKAERANGYRDSKVMITFKDGSTAEVQFQFKDFLDVKKGKVDLNINGENTIIGKNIQKNIQFSDKEKDIIINFCKTTNLEIPSQFYNLSLKKDNGEEVKENNIDFNADFTYNISRAIGNGDIKNKISEIDTILFDSALSKVAEKELKRVMKNKKSKKLFFTFLF
ncbi:MAG: hypothetical protein Q9M97_02485 [Candidatus Gracilibacteria bacterium]|nr:hypothetical protein [Candidatus Gracilibacteria bacterium]